MTPITGFAALLVGLVTTPASAYCISNLEDVIRDSEALFVGVPVRQSSLSSDNRIHRVVFRVTEMLKGEEYDEIAVWNETQWAEGYDVRWGEPNLIAAYRDRGVLDISGCAQMAIDLEGVRAALAKSQSEAGGMK